MRLIRREREVSIRKDAKRRWNNGLRRANTLEVLEGRLLLAASAAIPTWHNSLNPMDVNRDSRVTPQDALLVINDLLTHGTHSIGAQAASAAPAVVALAASSMSAPSYALDVNGDGKITPSDVLSVINQLSAADANDIFEYSLETEDLSGNPISTITVGEDFQLAMFVKDLRGTPPNTMPLAAHGGVFAGFANVAYTGSNGALATIPAGETTVNHDPLMIHGASRPGFFTLTPAGDVSSMPGNIIGAGAAATSFAAPFSPTNPPTQQALWTLTMHAASVGTENFSSSFDGTSGHDSLLYDRDPPVTADLIDFDNPSTNPLQLTITPADAPVRTGGTVSNLTVLQDSGLTSLGLGGLAYGPAPGTDEANDVFTYTVTAVPPASLGNIVLTDGNTVVTANTPYTLTQLQGMQFKPADDASGGPATFSWDVLDDGPDDSGTGTLSESLTVTVTAVSDLPARTAGSVNNLTVLQDSALTSLGLGSLAYGPAAGADEANDTFTFTVTAVPQASLGNILLANGSTVVTANTSYTLTQLQGMQFKPADDANGGPATFSWNVVDGPTAGILNTLNESLSVTVTAVSDLAVRTAGTVNNLTVLQDSGLTSLGLGNLAYGPAPGTDEANDTFTFTITAVPQASLGNIVLADGATVVTANTSYALAQLQGMQFKPADDGNGGPATFSWRVVDGPTPNGSLNTLNESLTITVTAVSDLPVRTAGTVNNLTVLEESGLTSLGLGGLVYGPAPGTDEANDTFTFTVTAVPQANLGNIVLADGSTVVTTNTNYTLTQLQGMQFKTAANANGGPAAFSWNVVDGATSNGSLNTLNESLSVTVTPVNDQPVRTAGAVNNLTVLEDSGLTSLGLGGLAYGPGGAGEEAGQTLTYTVTAVPAANLGNIVLADGSTVVTVNTSYTLTQLQGMQFETAAHAIGGPTTFSWSVKDNGGTSNGGVDTLFESLSVTVRVKNPGEKAFIRLQLSKDGLDPSNPANWIPGTTSDTTSLNPGEDFILNVFVQDTRDTGIATGIFAAYLNAAYDSSLVSVNGPIMYGLNDLGTQFHTGGSSFGAFPSGTFTPGHIGEAGAAAFSPLSTSPTNPGGEELLFSIPMVANNVGNVGVATFTPTAAVGPGHDVIEYLSVNNQPIPTSAISFESTQINIGSNVFLFTPDSLKVAHQEPDNGTITYTFNVTWFKPDSNLPTGTTATVQYSTSDGTATSGVVPGTDADYVPASGTLTFTVGQATTLPIVVTVNGDNTDEPDETFFVNLTQMAGQPAATKLPAIGTIQNDNDPPVTLSVTSAPASEGQPIIFTLSLSAVSGQTVSVAYNTADLAVADIPPGGALAVANVDYVPILPSIPPNPPNPLYVVTFMPGETKKTISVAGKADNLPNEQSKEYFQLQLTNPSHVALPTGPIEGQIIDVPPATLSGSVYVDINNDGIRQSSEAGIPHVPITVTGGGTSTPQTMHTDAQGNFTFVGLQPGVSYTLTETQPGFFVDGKDTYPSGAISQTNDQFTSIVLTPSQQAGGYNFGEMGLRAEFAMAFYNRRAFFSSTVVGTQFGTAATPVNLQNGDVWISFDGGWQGQRTIQAAFTPAQGSATMSLYDYKLNPLAISVPTATGAQLQFNGTGVTYFLKVTGTSNSVLISTNDPQLTANLTQSQGAASSAISASTSSSSPPPTNAPASTTTNGATSTFASSLMTAPVVQPLAASANDSDDDATDAALADEDDWVTQLLAA